MRSRATSQAGFAPVERSLREALEEWFAARPRYSDAAAAAATVATNSSALPRRAQPIVALLERRGLPSLAGRSVLDLGCGFGALAVYLAWHGARVTGIDPIASRFAVGEGVAREHGLEVRLRRGRMEALDAPPETFDAAVMNNTFCYLVEPADRHAALLEARRVLRPGAPLVVRDPNGLHPVDHFTGIPLLPLLPPAAGERVAAAAGRRRPAVRLVSPRALRHALLDAGFAEVRGEPSGPGLVRSLGRPLARYQHATARRPR